MRPRGRIEKRGKSYRVEIELGRDPITGDRDRVRRTFPTKREAERFLAEIVIENDDDRSAGFYFTLDQIVGRWYAERQHGERTRYDYELVEKWIPETLRTKPIGTLRPADFSKLLAALRLEGRSEWRLLRLHELLSGAFDLAWRYEWVRENPLRRVQRPNPRRKEPRPPRRVDVEKLVANASDELLLWIRLASTTGARRGEVAGLRWEDLVDVEDGGRGLWIRRAVSYAPNSGLVIGTTKTGTERLVALSPSLVAELDEARERQTDRARRLGDDWDPSRYMIGADPVGRDPWRPDRATRVFAELRDSLDLPGVRLKELRHYVATQLLAAGVDVRTVAGRLGHAQTSMTTDVYAAWLPESDRRAAELLD